MDRREVLQYGLLGGAASLAFPTNAMSATLAFDLSIEAVDVEMIDGQIVFMLLYYGMANGVRAPRPVLRARQGDTVTFSVRNNSQTRCGFSIPGVPAATINNIDPGQTGVVTFTAPRSGSYLYIDHTNAPVNRLVGLQGAFIVAPVNGTTVSGATAPYSQTMLTPEATMVFDALGAPGGRFPGNRWRPNDPEREKIWMLSSVEPALNAQVLAGAVLNGATVQARFTPRYFTINGFSGIDSSEDPNTSPKGYVGQPTLLRTMNAGGVTHSAHIHGNHVLIVAESGANGVFACNTNIFECDVWTLPPLARRDVVLPYERPPDIPAAAWPMKEEPFPLRYVFHCHTEMSNTAAGGNYPQGMVTHWELLGLAPPPAAV